MTSHVLVFLLPLLVLLGTGALSRDLIAQARIGMLDQGALIALLIAQRAQVGPPLVPSEDLSALTLQIGGASHSTVSLLDETGAVVSTTQESLSGATMAARLEVGMALGGIAGWRVRPGEVELSVAVPILVDGQVIGVVLLGRSPRQALEALGHMSPRLSTGGILALIVIIAGVFWVGQVLSHSLGALAAAARRLADGDLSAAGTLAGPQRSRISEVRELAGAFATMTERLRARLRYVREFASNVSHEFKTPLSTIRGTIELIRDDQEMPPKQRARFLDNALHELSRMSALVSGLLDLARAEESADRNPIDLFVMLEDVVDRYPGVGLSGEAGTILADPRQLETVAINLIENAHRHGAPPVQVVAFKDGKKTGFQVTDAGPGVSAANRQRLFDRFFTTDREQGTGLGLALVKTICEAHGGSISVQSAPGHTAFTVTLPQQ